MANARRVGMAARSSSAVIEGLVISALPLRRHNENR
jgi:hypothetical protein